jgi:hypothetical protein
MVTDKQHDELVKIAQETRDSVRELHTLWDGGPGNWQICGQHSSDLKDKEKRLREHEKRINMALGAIAFIGFLGIAVGLYTAVIKH